MGFINSTCSFTRFRILDPVPAELWESILERLKKYSFRDIDDSTDMQAHGWVAFDDLLDTDWRTSPHFSTYLAFSLRFDARRIPAGVVKKHMLLALKHEMETLSQQNRQFVSRERKKELREQVMLRLQQRFLPVPGMFNVLWNTEKNEIWFASTQGKMIDLFQDLFLQTFDLHLEALTPYNIATTIVDETDLALLDTLRPAEFSALS